MKTLVSVFLVLALCGSVQAQCPGGVCRPATTQFTPTFQTFKPAPNFRPAPRTNARPTQAPRATKVVCGPQGCRVVNR